MTAFIGRQLEIETLNALLTRVRAATNDPKPGQCLLMRGRRRIGKSSLVEAFVHLAGVPSVFYSAAPSSIELQDFTQAVASSTLPDRAVFEDAQPGNWSAAFRQLAGILPDDQPSVVVMDEVPYLVDQVDAFEGVLQRAWDRELCRKPVFLILIGSDLSMMEALNSYGRPFHQRGREMILGALNSAEVGQMLDLPAAEAFDAALITGGLPQLCAEWTPGAGLWDFLSMELANPVSPSWFPLSVRWPQSSQHQLRPEQCSLRSVAASGRSQTSPRQAALHTLP
ncbi:hypothetical protein GCM10010435_00320 [Winogradskya consettensis]|uniref:Uncharacterized protein n=1 Tax=Winogradskya consettensis TaxID=113560 RepID=A0A919S8F3_9ACTN|nr:ATP-binding protein [Actinoplanes consettensis]GIM66580.1 hypothetical protein Aco04nite_02630 [Actinoplanes consettensis]